MKTLPTPSTATPTGSKSVVETTAVTLPAEALHRFSVSSVASAKKTSPDAATTMACGRERGAPETSVVICCE